MRLLHSTQWKFEEFLESSLLIYAILSHHWGKDEISYQALQLAIKERGATEILQLSAMNFPKPKDAGKRPLRKCTIESGLIPAASIKRALRSFLRLSIPCSNGTQNST
jgi:hypothetical protein